MFEFKKLQNQPLKIVLAEFRFSPVTLIEKYIPEMQERFRKQYPVFEESEDQIVKMHPKNMSLQTVSHWSFVTADRVSAVNLNQQRIVYVTTGYDRFPDFQKSCQQAVSALTKVVEPGMMLRVGLR